MTIKNKYPLSPIMVCLTNWEVQARSQRLIWGELRIFEIYIPKTGFQTQYGHFYVWAACNFYRLNKLSIKYLFGQICSGLQRRHLGVFTKGGWRTFWDCFTDFEGEDFLCETFQAWVLVEVFLDPDEVPLHFQMKKKKNKELIIDEGLSNRNK